MMTVTGCKAQDMRNAKLTLQQIPIHVTKLIANSSADEDEETYDRCIRNCVRQLFTAARVVSTKLSWYRPVIGI